MRTTQRIISFEKNLSENRYFGSKYEIFLGDNPQNRMFVGVCRFKPNDEEKSVYVSNLDIEPKYQQQGYGTVLLYEVLKDMSEMGFRRVELTDASDRCREKKNIYRLMGLSYKDNYDGEMEGNIRYIIHGKRKRRLSRTNPYAIRKKRKLREDK